MFDSFSSLQRLFQSILLLPRYLQRNHDLIEQSLAKYGFTDEELRAQEQALLEEEANANRTQGDEESENKSDDKAEDKNERAEGQIEKCDGVTAAESTNNESKKTN